MDTKREVKTRKLISLYNQDGKWYVDFAYYDENGRYTGEYENCLITDEQLYLALKQYLTYRVDEWMRTQRDRSDE
jgi:hypothetical protein